MDRHIRLLIAIPTKTAPEYLDRQKWCEETWLKDSPCEYKFFRDSEHGLDDQDPLARQKRMKVMCQYALTSDYDYLFRVDSDTYVWVDRLLASGFEQHEYMGYCLDYPKENARNRTAFAGPGFFLNRKAMIIVTKTAHFPHGDAYWGDIWTGQLLYDHGIECHRDLRFKEADGGTTRLADFPPDHDYISVHKAEL